MPSGICLFLDTASRGFWLPLGERSPILGSQNERPIRSYNFEIETQIGGGYPPFPAVVAKGDPVHARFGAVKARKPIRY